MSQDRVAEAQERIADALEHRNDLFMAIIYGLLAGALVIIGFFVIMMIWQPIYDFFYFDVIGNERTSIGVGTAITYYDPIDDCSYSEDEQLCYQMSRIADALESSQNKTEVLQIDD